MPNAENKQMLEDIKSDIQAAGAMWVVDYRGLTVKDIQSLRRAVREADAQMKVYKNTIMHIALAELDCPDLDAILAGPSAFVFAGEDPVASAKVLRDFAKGNENLEIKGGMMDGAFVDAAQVNEIAALPSREELIAKLLGTINNPLVKTVRVLNGPMEAFARVVSAIEEQKAA
ncbi:MULTISPECIES: 50S ribosomal protein L10 [unclassified Adlercreutzia]|uniref:50S ribosomal protein L10 n=1 Tax=unclassified Adlercreutzia TaxID=2636013 RepID=UPI0013EA8EFC|nr:MULTISPECIES: 50S ribosomal protein L10 [unclassified Adlercreutzia]